MTTAQSERTIEAHAIGDHGILTLIGAGPGQPGPWPFVSGVPNLETDLVGPPPEYLAVAAWAA